MLDIYPLEWLAKNKIYIPVILILSYDGDNRPYCDMCQEFAHEDAEHLVIHCSYFKNIREHIFLDMSEIERSHGIIVFKPTENNIHLVMGKVPPRVNYDITFEMYRKIASIVHLMYSVLVKAREGVC